VNASRAIRGYVFDAYGTLFDVHSVVEAGRAITSDPITLSMTWRQKQLEYTWLRALMGRCEDFWTVTEAARRTSPGMLSRGHEGARASAGMAMRDSLEWISAVYALGPEALGLPAGDILFVSSNAWDVAGAKAPGYQVAWYNRLGAPPEELNAPS